MTIAEVSARAGVSTATVSRVLNHTGQVSPHTVERVLAVIEEMNYIPNTSARVLAGGRTHTLGLVIPEIGSRSLLPLLAGIESATRSTSYGILIYSTGGRTVTSDELLNVLGPHKVDGYLIYVNSLDKVSLQYIYTAGFPMVLLHQNPSPDLPIPGVSFQNQTSSKSLIDHLIEVHGCQRIAYLRGPQGHEDSLLREKGYQVSLEEHSIAYDQGLIGYGGFNHKDAYQTVTQWIDEKRSFDALFAGADDSAAGAILAFREKGVHVPEDVAVVGFDDIDLGYSIQPPLTTIHADFELAGRIATQMLASILKNEDFQLETILPTELVIRRSCGCQQK